MNDLIKYGMYRLGCTDNKHPERGRHQGHRVEWQGVGRRESANINQHTDSVSAHSLLPVHKMMPGREQALRKCSLNQ